MNNSEDQKYKVKDLVLSDKVKTQKIKKLLSGFNLSNRKIQRIGNVFKSEMKLALAEKPSSLQMENTYIPELPDGTEEGKYLALDLGGTNFRVILLELKQNCIEPCEIVKHYKIADELRLGCGIKLFNYLAECLVDFVCENNLENVSLPLGFTFSFPMRQHSLDSGSLVTWTKSFNCSSVVDRDVVKLLRESLKRLGHNHIDVLAILNDTTGTLIQGARLDKNTRIGIVVGTGSNACYVENADSVQHWETERHNEKTVVIDIEWGAFGDNGTLDFVKTEYDVVLDNTSLLVNSFTFEKYIGGKYLGELVRIVIESLMNQNLLFDHAPKTLFPLPWTFGTNNISLIELDNLTGGVTETEKILNTLGYERNQNYYTNEDIEIIKYVAAIISHRAAKLVAATTASLLNHLHRDVNISNCNGNPDQITTIAIDGSVYKHHPRLKGWLERYIKLIVPDINFGLMLAEDGSGKGAALVAAIALKLRQRCT